MWIKLFCEFLFLSLSVFFLKDRDGGTDLNLVFRHFLERMSFIKTRVKAARFKEQYHVIIVFTDGNFSVSMYQIHIWYLASLILIQINLKELKGAANNLRERWFPMPVIIHHLICDCWHFDSFKTQLKTHLFQLSIVCFIVSLFIFNWMDFFTTGIYNMGGSPLPTVEKIKNMVYLNHTNEMGDDNRAEHLGENTLGHTHKPGFAKTP